MKFSAIPHNQNAAVGNQIRLITSLVFSNPRSTRNSMWLLPRPDKRRSSSLFSDGIGDFDLTGSGSGKSQRFSSWQALLPRSSVMGRGVRLNSMAGQMFSSEKCEFQTLLHALRIHYLVRSLVLIYD